MVPASGLASGPSAVVGLEPDQVIDPHSNLSVATHLPTRGLIWPHLDLQPEPKPEPKPEAKP